MKLIGDPLKFFTQTTTKLLMLWRLMKKIQTEEFRPPSWIFDIESL